ncbi:hypothetical protein [Streptacidiphilus rugosus]|uniref:hypothetical protein n=1 Tax=Streptacidiphilus rugosus TaxID=405783 RepID=UPI0005600FCF|nr:hypothetical protein [Streptacidiphilus rugosus]
MLHTAPEVRRQGLSTRREARIRNQGSYIRVTGKIGKKSPGAADGFSGRERTIGGDSDRPLYLKLEQIAAIMDAYLAGDDARAWEALSDALGDQYFGGVEMRDITAMDFLRDYGGESPEM